MDIRNLKADEIEAKVSTVKESGVQILLYKTARTDTKILDEVYGPENWKNHYDEIKGNLFCTIEVYNEKLHEWISKQDCGVESQFGDKEKGEASDAFKRAGFKWGIGTELYNSPFIWVSSKDCKIEKTTRNGKETFVCKDSFTVEIIRTTKDKKIAVLSLLNSEKKRVFSFKDANLLKIWEEENKK